MQLQAVICRLASRGMPSDALKQVDVVSMVYMYCVCTPLRARSHGLRRGVRRAGCSGALLQKYDAWRRDLLVYMACPHLPHDHVAILKCRPR